jgi:crossover junction endodeoxyribonuclease RuvC
MTLHLGIDIGVQGAVAILDRSGDLVAIHDMPVLKDGPAERRAINAPLLAAVIFKSHADRAFVEHVSARPGEGAVGAFACC